MDRWLNSLVGLFIFIVTGLCEGGQRLVLFIVGVDRARPRSQGAVTRPGRDWLMAYLARCRRVVDPLPQPIAT